MPVFLQSIQQWLTRLCQQQPNAANTANAANAALDTLSAQDIETQQMAIHNALQEVLLERAAHAETMRSLTRNYQLHTNEPARSNMLALQYPYEEKRRVALEAQHDNLLRQRALLEGVYALLHNTRWQKNVLTQQQAADWHRLNQAVGQLVAQHEQQCQQEQQAIDCIDAAQHKAQLQRNTKLQQAHAQLNASPHTSQHIYTMPPSSPEAATNISPAPQLPNHNHITATKQPNADNLPNATLVGQPHNPKITGG